MSVEARISIQGLHYSKLFFDRRTSKNQRKNKDLDFIGLVDWSISPTSWWLEQMAKFIMDLWDLPSRATDTRVVGGLVRLPSRLTNTDTTYTKPPTSWNTDRVCGLMSKMCKRRERTSDFNFKSVGWLECRNPKSIPKILIQMFITGSSFVYFGKCTIIEIEKMG